MKTTKINAKLSLGKETLTKLTIKDANKINGGGKRKEGTCLVTLDDLA